MVIDIRGVIIVQGMIQEKVNQQRNDGYRKRRFSVQKRMRVLGQFLPKEWDGQRLYDNVKLGCQSMDFSGVECRLGARGLWTPGTRRGRRPGWDVAVKRDQ